MNAEIITVANQKGGCGKTTTSGTLARLSVLDSYRTLLIDLDPNNSATTAIDATEGMLPALVESKSVLNLFQENPPEPSDLVIETKEGYDMIIGSYDLVDADVFLMSEAEASKYIADAIFDDPGMSQYDRIFIDTGGRVGQLLYAAVVAADKVVTPCKPTPLDTKQTLQIAGYVKKCAKTKSRDVNYQDRPVKLAKVFFNEADEKAGISTDVVGDFISEFAEPDAISPTVIPVSNEVKRAQKEGMTIVDYRPKSRAAQAYVALYNEIFDSNFDLKDAKNG